MVLLLLFLVVVLWVCFCDRSLKQTKKGEESKKKNDCFLSFPLKLALYVGSKIGSFLGNPENGVKCSVPSYGPNVPLD